MLNRNLFSIATGLVAFLTLSPLNAGATEHQQFQLTMMDMMPMGDSGMAQPSGNAMPMGDDKMPMDGAKPAQGQMPMSGGGSMPPASSSAGAMAAPGQNQTRGCGMMEMMQTMMRMGAQQGMPSTSGGTVVPSSQPSGSSAARLEGRIAFLRSELRVTEAQMPAWESFATALRAGREHLDAARGALQDSTANADPMMRLQSFEKHLTERAEAIHTSGIAFNTLYGKLDDAQKRVATANMLPFIGAF